MIRKVLHGAEARKAIAEGVNTLAQAVRVTMGPRGRTVLLERNPMFTPVATLDGITVAKEVTFLENPFAEMGAKIIRQAADETSQSAGDGTTTATVLAHAIFTKGLEYLDQGANPVALKRGIDAAVEVVVEHLKSIAQPISDHDQIAQVGTISTHGDRFLGELIADAMKRVGREGIITIDESMDSETTLHVTEGMQLDRGWLGAPFVMDAERLQSVLHEPYLLITERKLWTMTEELSVVLAECGREGRPVLVVASDYDQPFVVSLIHNNQQGLLRSVAIKAPSFGDQRRAMLEDLAIVTGGYAFTEDCGRKLDSITKDDLGRAKRIVVEKHDANGTTTIQGGYGDKERKESRVSLLRALIESADNDLQRELLKQRLAKMAAGVAVIKVGGVTTTEQRERMDRVDDAICATRAAAAEGIVIGGGMALFQSWPKILALGESMAQDDEWRGVRIILQSILEPFKQIISNAGENADGLANYASALLAQDDFKTGYNAATGSWEDLIDCGVIDPTKVVRCAITNAASAASSLLLTESAICAIPEKR